VELVLGVGKGWNDLGNSFSESRDTDRLTRPPDLLQYGQTGRLEFRDRDFVHRSIAPPRQKCTMFIDHGQKDGPLSD
jgi:hypothetical protein